MGLQENSSSDERSDPEAQCGSIAEFRACSQSVFQTGKVGVIGTMWTESILYQVGVRIVSSLRGPFDDWLLIYPTCLEKGVYTHDVGDGRCIPNACVRRGNAHFLVAYCPNKGVGPYTSELLRSYIVGVLVVGS